MIKNLRKYENFHILLWLVKDSCWCMNIKTVGVIMIAPTLLAAIHITWLGRNNWTDLAHNIAVSCWITANAIWMIGEFFYDDTLRPYAIVFFVLGLLVVSAYYLQWGYNKLKTKGH